MEGLFGLLLFLSLSLLVLGLIRPSLVLRGRTLTRVRAIQLYGGLALLSLVLIALFTGGLGAASLVLALFALPIVLVAGLIHPPLVLPAESSRKRVAKTYGLSILFFLVLGIITLDAETPEAIAPTPTPTASIAPTPEPTPELTPTPTPEATPSEFQLAVLSATDAADRSQSAIAPEEWQDISMLWQEASNLMGQVPQTSSFYAQAQEKTREYAANAESARQKAAELAPPQSVPEVPISETPIPESETPTYEEAPQPEPIATPDYQAPPASNDGGGYVAGSCAELRSMGLSDFRPGDPNYTSSRDRDGDGIACESS